MAILGEDQSGGEPSLEYCMAYADQTGFPPERMIIDASWTKTFEKIANGGSGGIGLPWDGILDARGMVYMYNSEQSNQSPYEIVDELLAAD